MMIMMTIIVFIVIVIWQLLACFIQRVFFLSVYLFLDSFEFLCNLHPGNGQRPYGHDALVASPDHDYEVDSGPSEHQASLPFYDNRQCKCFVYLSY